MKKEHGKEKGNYWQPEALGKCEIFADLLKKKY